MLNFTPTQAHAILTHLLTHNCHFTGGSMMDRGNPVLELYTESSGMLALQPANVQVLEHLLRVVEPVNKVQPRGTSPLDTTAPVDYLERVSADLHELIVESQYLEELAGKQADLHNCLADVNASLREDIANLARGCAAYIPLRDIVVVLCELHAECNALEGMPTDCVAVKVWTRRRDAAYAAAAAAVMA